MILRRLILIALLAALALSGCTMLNPGPPPVRVQLFPQKPARSSLPPVSRQLVVEMPSSSRDVDSDSIALYFNDREVRYLAGYRWTDTAPALFRRALVDALNANGGLTGVSNENAGISADARLVSDLKQFHLMYDDVKSPPTAGITVSFQIIDLSNGTIMASTLVSAQKKAADLNHTSLIKAVESALSEVLEEAVTWVDGAMRNMPPKQKAG